MHSVLAKLKAKEAGLLTPEFFHIEHIDDAKRIVGEANRTFIPPVVVKAVNTRPGQEAVLVSGHVFILQTAENLLQQGALSVLIEEYARGRGVAASVVEGLRGETLYATPISGTGVTRVEAEEIKRATKLMHRALALRHYSRSHFVVTSKGIVYLGTESLPSLGAESPMAVALASVGVSAADFMTHLVDLALE